jgi:phospholipid N-methyltransferase
MTEDIGAESGPIIELGPGTGAFTQALLTRGLKQEDLTLVEYDHDFAKRLRLRFPGARVLRMDATRLRRAHLFEPASVGAVISGLPLLNFSRRQIFAILVAAFGYLRPDGAFYQFTYGPVCPVPKPVLERLGLRETFVGRVFLNVPPATVYRIDRKWPAMSAPDEPAGRKPALVRSRLRSKQTAFPPF